MATKLTPRLATALQYVRPDRRLADIGTDHAYLPIHIVASRLGKGGATGVPASGAPIPERPDCPMAIASDINRGPVARAQAHIEAAGLSAHIRTVCTPGLDGLEDYDPEDIIIFGMGGELIVSILAAAPWVHRVGKRLILQPMTHAEKLRAYLSGAGFSIVGETLSREGERIYQTLCAEPKPGTAPAATAALAPADPEEGPAVLWAGAWDLHRGDAEQVALYRALLERLLRSEGAARDARRAAGQHTEEADRLLRALRTALARARAEDSWPGET